MNPSEKITQNGTLEAHNCPVCNTSNELNNVHCTTCAWYFPLKDTPQYSIELSRAKQQFQMISSFNQVYQHMQIQSKVLEKMSFRLDGLEADMKRVKDQNFIIVNPELESETEYPKLEPIAMANSFDTAEKRKDWWENLEDQWKKAFNAAFLQKKETKDLPTDEELLDLFESPTFRAVGPRGMYPNITFELSNLSGIKHLTNLKYLFVTHGSLVNLNGIEHLSMVESLYVNSNKLTSVKPIYYLKKIKNLYINANQVNSIIPAKYLKNLTSFYCNYNKLVNLHGIIPDHKKTLKEFYCLPNEQLKLTEIKRIEEGLNIKCSKA